MSFFLSCRPRKYNAKVFQQNQQTDFIHSVNSLQSSAKMTHSSTNIRRSAVKQSINQNNILKGNYGTLLLTSDKYISIITYLTWRTLECLKTLNITVGMPQKRHLWKKRSLFLFQCDFESNHHSNKCLPTTDLLNIGSLEKNHKIQQYSNYTVVKMEVTFVIIYITLLYGSLSTLDCKKSLCLTPLLKHFLYDGMPSPLIHFSHPIS